MSCVRVSTRSGKRMRRSREQLLFLSRLLIAVIVATIYLYIFKVKVIDGD